MNYGTILKESWTVWWKHKSLWIFGAVLALSGQSEYSFSANYRESYSYTSGQTAPPQFPDIPGRELMLSFLDNPMPYLLGLVLLTLLSWIVGNIVSAWAQGALIGMVDEIDRTGSTSFRSGVGAGSQKVFPLTLLTVVLQLPALVVSLLALAGGMWFLLQISDLFRALITGESLSERELERIFEPLLPAMMTGFVAIFPLICISALLGIVIYLLYHMSARSLVLENLGPWPAIRRGWQVAIKNIGHVLLNAVILYIARVVFGILAAVPALILLIPVGRALLRNDWTPLTIAGAVAVGIYYLVASLGVGGALTAFNSTLWTRLYKAMLGKGEPAAVETAPKV